MSTIILHDKKDNNWSSLGIGPLSEAINPIVTRERNGIFDLSFRYPVNGPLFKELKVGRWVVADAGPTIQAQSQRFEIAGITKPIKGIVTVYCEHFRYQLLRSIVKVGSVYKDIPAQTALNQLRNQMEPKGEFTFFSDIATKSSIDFSDPAKFKNAQEVLGGVRGSILDNFGGEYVFNNNQVRLMAKAGTEKNVIIAYGKNLTDINQEESIENTFTSVYGWAKIDSGNDEKIITLPEVYLDSEYVGNYTQRRIQMVDFSDKEPKDVAALRAQVQAYIKNNNVGIPKVSIKTSYVDLASSVMDNQLKNLEMIDLCDWVTVVFNQLEINTSAQIIKTVWNVSLDRYESVELGEARTDFTKVIDDSKPDMDVINDKVDWLEKAQEEASDIIHNPGKGHVVIYPSLADPQEILIMDTTDINTAMKVWRWNAGGLGFSSTGYNGMYELAMTNNGAIVADRMTTGTLRAINIIGVNITGSVFETQGNFGKIIIQDGKINFYNSAGTGYAEIHPYNTNDVIETLFINSRDQVNIASGTWDIYSHKSTYGGLELDTRDLKTTLLKSINGSLALEARYNNKLNQEIHLRNGFTRLGGFFRIEPVVYGDKNGLQIGNNAEISFYSDLNMNGFKIINSSDIRLKENIKATSVDALKEISKLEFYDYNYRMGYRPNNENKELANEPQTGLIAQYTPYLSEKNDYDNYLGINMNKQVNLNSMGIKALLEKVESLERKNKVTHRNKRKYHRGGV